MELQSLLKNGFENTTNWGKRRVAAFMGWVTSPSLVQYTQHYQLRIYVYLLLTPILLFVPMYSLLGSFKMFSFGFWIGLFTFLFSLCTWLVFIGFPFLIIYVKFSRNTYWKSIWITTSVLMGISLIFWGFRFYQSFLPDLLK